MTALTGARKLVLLAALVASVGIIVRLFWTGSTQTVPKRRQLHQGRNQSVLFLSNSEHGLANVFLATSHALLIHHKAIEVHFASFQPFQKHVSKVSDSALHQSSASTPITFHELKGPTLSHALDSEGYFVNEITHVPGRVGAAAYSQILPTFIAPWNGSQYFSLYEQISQIIDEVDPALIVVDIILGPALDATKDKNRRFAILSPNALTDVVGQFQPRGRMFWKYPATGSGHAFPTPLHLIPDNIWMHIRVILRILTAPELKKKQKYLKEKGLSNPINMLTMYDPDVLWITPSSPEADFPVSVIPENVKPCGPISISTASAADQDPELASWLERAPTVLINLGSMFKYDEKSAKAMAGAVKVLLDQTDVQVLWKFSKREHPLSIEESSNDYLNIVSEYLGSRLRVESWISIDPTVILETGNIVASVHHGGSSCYHEAVENGIPQVVLPMWADCYEFATRVEWLGIGLWGSKAAPLNWTREDLSSAFLKVLADDDAAKSMRSKANRLGKSFRGKPGRVCAADELAKLASLDGIDAAE